MEIRPLAASDETDRRALWRGYPEFKEEPSPDETTAQTWRRLPGDERFWGSPPSTPAA